MVTPAAAPMIAAIGRCVMGPMLVDTVPDISTGRWLVVDEVPLNALLETTVRRDGITLMADALLEL